MVLQDLIEWLESQNQDAVVPYGFGEPMSYRGYYDNVAFRPVENARIGDMLDHAKSALGATFEGYKGGEYKMEAHTDCWIAHYGSAGGDLIGPTLISYWVYFISQE